uniref:Uncharacterized protein n=1 Tax=Plectus sambesii TaxID=2011161 RepID=A0A914X1R2_9BILA
MYFVFGVLLAYYTYICKTTIEAQSIEYTLHQTLMDGYNKAIRPVKNVKDKVTVQIQPILYSLIQVDERIGSMEFLQWLELRWRDAYLTWDPQSYDNVLRTTFMASDIWVPDITVLNQMDELKYMIDKEDVIAEVFYDGTVTVAYNMLLNLRCHNYDLAKFPFDVQTCSTRYGPWAHSSDQVVITTGKVIENVNQFREHTEWTIEAFGTLYNTSKKMVRQSLLNVKLANGTEMTLNDTRIFEEIHFELKLRRKAGYYVYTLVLPTLITTTLCFVGLFSPFDVSGNREERVSLGITAMLSMTVILMLVAGEMPRSSGNHPLLGRFVMFEIVMSTVATIATVIVMMLHQRAELAASNPPQWLVKLTYLALCIRETIDWNNKVASKSNGTDQKTEKERIQSEDLSASVGAISKAKYALSNNAALVELRKLTNNLKLKSKYSSVKHYWINIFRLVDNVLLIVFNAANLL